MDLVEIAKEDEKRRAPDPLRVAGGVLIGGLLGRSIGGRAGGIKVAAGMSPKQRAAFRKRPGKVLKPEHYRTVGRGAATGALVGAGAGGAAGLMSDR